MNHGKKVCKILKEIRQQIADKNDIEYVTSECHFQGECQGTCPKCEAEVRYLETELNRRRQLGKAVTIAGISLGVASAFSAYGSTKQDTFPQNKISSEIADTISPVLLDTISLKIDMPIIDITGAISERRITGLPALQITTFPKYSGGKRNLLKFLRNNIVYPQKSQKNNLQDTVLVNFYVGTDGSLSNIRLVKKVDDDLGKEVVRVVEMMPKWKPAQQRKTKEKTGTFYCLRIMFKNKKVKSCNQWNFEN